MAVSSGAGAAVFSGAGYQARVAAYVIVTAICEVECYLSPNSTISTLGFETSECIDDINIELTDSKSIYIQAKAKIDFSLSADGNLRSVLKQFVSQAIKSPNIEDKYLLVTTSRSSKKVTYDLRAALVAFSISPIQQFFRDQPKALTEIINELRATMLNLQVEVGQPSDLVAVDQIIRQSSVVVLDIDEGDSLEQAVILMLESRQYSAARALWGKFIADCIAHAKARHTLRINDLTVEYRKYIHPESGVLEQASEELLQIEFLNTNFCVGREVVLCHVPEDDPLLAPGAAILEFYRFDKNCKERIQFADESVVLADGRTLPLIRRAATYAGLTRLIEANPLLINGAQVCFYPVNSDEDYELSQCAELHRNQLKESIKRNQNLLKCSHCGKAVFEKEPCLIETEDDGRPAVAMSHNKCLAPSDRLLGSASSDLVEDHPELIDFDINAWFRASHGGQLGISGAKLFKRKAVIAWNGLNPKGPHGQYVIELQLQGGGRELVTQRNGVHRFSKVEADKTADEISRSLEIATYQNDPMCYTDQTKSFGSRSVLIEQFGGIERILSVDKARVRKYEERFAVRYSIPGHWYAPLLYLRDANTELPLTVLDTLPLISNPLKLKHFLENWAAAHIAIPEYETMSILNDDEFDEFMRWLEYQPWQVVIDPIFDSDTQLVSGFPIHSMERILSNKGND